MIRRPPRSTLDRSSAAQMCIRDSFWLDETVPDFNVVEDPPVVVFELMEDDEEEPVVPVLAGGSVTSATRSSGNNGQSTGTISERPSTRT